MHGDFSSADVATGMVVTLGLRDSKREYCRVHAGIVRVEPNVARSTIKDPIPKVRTSLALSRIHESLVCTSGTEYSCHSDG